MTWALCRYIHSCISCCSPWYLRGLQGNL